MGLILDTGPVLALLNAGDRDHARCVELIDSARESLIIPAATLVEIDYWVDKHLTPDAWLSFTEDITSGAYRLEPVTEDDVARAARLQHEYADLRLGFVDASVIALCERLGEAKVATLDRRHFSVVRPQHVSALELLPA